MTIRAGAQLLIYFVDVRFRDNARRKKDGGRLVIVEFGADALNAEAFANLLRRSKYKDITFVWHFETA